MSVNTPVLERRINTRSESGNVNNSFRNTVMSDEDRHNSQISSNYAKLINPESTLNDIIAREPVEAAYEERYEERYVAPVREVYTQKPYLVENARADAEIFRADSVINRKSESMEASVNGVSDVEEEENEDLRPTQTTIQYRTAGVKSSDEGRVEIHASSRKSSVSKRDKIVIAAVICTIVALFVLIIVNSAIISGLNNELSYLQSSLTSAKAAYSGVSDQVQEYLSNLSETVGDFAANNGMILR